jgi:Rad3-related DNA helicase
VTLPSSPRDLGLPQDAWRPVQVYALAELAERREPVIMLNAPMGTGKSLLAAAWARMSGRQLTYCCVTKDLQAQWLEAYPGQAAVLMGRDNYPTLDAPHLFPDLTCDDCRLRRGTCPYCHDASACPYRAARDAAEASDLAALNVAYWLRSCNGPVPLFSAPLIERQAVCWRCGASLDSATVPVCARCRWLRCPCGACSELCPGGPLLRERVTCFDEADELEGVLRDHCSVGVSRYWLERLMLPEPKYKTANASHQETEWLPWLEAARSALDGEAKAAAASAADMAGLPGAKRRRTARRLAELADRIGEVREDMQANPGSWIRGSGDSLGGRSQDGSWQPGVEFKPLDVARQAKHLVWRHSRQFLCMSATLPPRDVFASRLGLDPSQVAFIDIPCTFPVENRRVYYWPTATNTKRNRDSAWPAVVAALDSILDCYPERVLVHTHSYELRKYVVEHSRHAGRMQTYTRAAERTKALQTFYATPGAVMVAPSLERGVDMHGDRCRCVVVLQMPKPSLGDPVVSALLHQPGGGYWYTVETARALVQSLGRAVRSPTDRADGWILDSEFNRLYTYPGLLPSWFVEGVVTDQRRVAQALDREGIA